MPPSSNLGHIRRVDTAKVIEFTLQPIKEKINDTTYLVKIPNKEVNSFFRNLFVEIVFRGKNSIADLKKALQSKDVKAIIEIIEEVVLNAMSFYDTDSRCQLPNE